LDQVDRIPFAAVFGKVRIAVPGATLRMVGGTGDEQRNRDARAVLLEHAVQAGCSDGIEFIGVVPRDDLVRLLRRSDVLMLPRDVDEYTQSAFPNKLGEYLASARPVVATTVSDISDVLEDRVSAYLVPPGDTVACARAVVHALSHQQEADAVGRAGRLVAERLLDCRAGGARLVRHVEYLRHVRGVSRRST
jgi:glycosyltransferase involved in cell wall biosynthesis